MVERRCKEHGRDRNSICTVHTENSAPQSILLSEIARIVRKKTGTKGPWGDLSDVTADYKGGPREPSLKATGRREVGRKDKGSRTQEREEAASSVKFTY